MAQATDCFQEHLKNIYNFGPIPRHIEVIVKSNQLRYQVQLPQQDGRKTLKAFSNHPLSPAGRQEWGSILTRAGEEIGKKSFAHGAAHPPIIYKPGEWIWEPSQNYQHALHKAFQLFGIGVKEADFYRQENKNAVDILKDKNPELYHPRDREDLAAFENEHLASCWARHFGRGLIIVAPEIRKDYKDRKLFLSYVAASRTAVRARWSTGDQEDLAPLILGCLPRSPEDRQPGSFPTAWYALVPIPSLKVGFVNLWNFGCKWDKEAAKFHYTNPDNFAWAVVAIQRTIVLGAVKISDEDLGDYITQYGQYLVAEEGHGSNRFLFKRSQAYAGPKVTFNDLTSWILTSGKSSSAWAYAEEWNEAVRFYVRYQKSSNEPNWKAFMQAATALQFKK